MTAQGGTATPARAARTPLPPEPPVDAIVHALDRDGIAAIPGAFSVAWVDELREDFEAAFELARSYPGGTIDRGPHRYYFAVPPERVRGFVDLVSHPVVAAVSAAVLGPDYRVVELAFDVPLPGAVRQPWHRDFPMPRETAQEHRLTSLAFNLTTVDVTPELAPFEIAPGTHWDGGADFAHGMFPPPEAAERYDSLASRRFPRRGDLSVRTGLAVHRGTANVGERPRAVLILGVVGPEVEAGAHELVLTRSYADTLPAGVRSRLATRLVDKLSPLVQKHDIEGLVMGG